MQLTDPAKGVYTAEFTAPIDGEAEFSVNDLLLPDAFGNWATFLYAQQSRQGEGEHSALRAQFLRFRLLKWFGAACPFSRINFRGCPAIAGCPRLSLPH